VVLGSATKRGCIMPGQKLTSARVVKTWFDIVFVIGVAGGCLLALWLLVSPLVMSSQDSPADIAIPVSMGTGSLRPVITLQQTESASEIANPRIVDGRGELRFETSSWAMQFFTSLVMLLGIAVVVYVVYLVRAILGTVLEGQPFAAVNVRRIRIIGSVLIAVGFLVPAIEYLAARAVLARVTLEGFAIRPPFDIREDTVVAGLLVLVLAAIFGYGAQLETDKSLTI
jgi:hypothetical protein